MELSTLPRNVVREALRQMHRPIALAERVARRVGVDVPDEWLPERAFERFEGDVQRLVGSLLRDAELTEEGRRHDARAKELRRAARLEGEADAKRTAAKARFTARHETVERQRKAVGKAAAELERQRAAEHDAGRKRARQIARGREEAAAQADRARQQTADQAERAAAATRVVEEAQAFGAGVRAAQAEAHVQRLDQAVEHERADRKQHRGPPRQDR